MFGQRDAPHRLWNDFQRSVAAYGLESALVLGTLVFNCGLAPFGSSGNPQGIRSSMILLSKHSEGKHLVTLAESFLPAISKQNGWDLSCTTVQDAAAAIQQAAKIGTTKIIMPRWFGWPNAASRWLPIWAAFEAVLSWHLLRVNSGALRGSGKKRRAPHEID